MNHKFSILQIKNHSSLKNFADYRWLTECLGGFDIADYETVYEGEIDSDNDIDVVLDNIFEIFNIDQPLGFRGHSLSVSDVVVVDGVKYFCDSFGWKNV